jgi:hypothetical protein
MSKNTGTSELINYFDLYSLGAIGVAGIIYANDGVEVAQVGTALPTNLKNVSGAGIVSFGSNFLGFNGNNNLYFSGNSKGYCEFAFNNSGTGRTYTFPSSSGTVALVGGSGVGTVTSVAALTLGTTGTDLSSTVATGTTTPVITLNVPTASASNRGALSSADWTTFNNKASTAALAAYLPLAGGTLTGPLNGTTATFSGDLIAVSATLNTPANAVGVLLNGRTSDNVSQIRFGANTGGGAYNTIQASPTSFDINSQGNTPITFGTNVGGGGGTRVTITGTGAVTLTGALNGTSATFTSASANQLTLNGGSTIATRLIVARGTDDSSQNLLLGWNGITVQRTSVPLSSPQTEFSIIQQGSDGSRTPFYIASTGAATFSSPNIPDSTADAGNLYVFTTDGPAADKGAKIMMGGIFTGATKYGYASISGRNESGTAGNVSGYMTFATHNNTGGHLERMRITSGGDVGINVTPTSGNRFWVKGSSTSSGDSTILAQNSASTNLFYVLNNGNVVMPNGNVLIGTPSDASGKLQVLGADNAIVSQIKSASGMLQVYTYLTAADGPIIQALDGAAANYKNLRIECIATTIKGPNSIVTNGAAANINLHTTNAYGADIGGTIGFGGLFNGSASTEFAVIAGKKENATINNLSGYLAFYTRAAATDPIERMRITSGGDIIKKGTLADLTLGSSGAEVFFSRNNANYIVANGGTSCDIRIISNTNGVVLSAGGTSWGSLSDENSKDIIEPIENACYKLSQVRTVIGKYKTDDEYKRRLFLIAQDIEKVYPEAVFKIKNENKEESLGLNYQDLIPVLVKAIQEQQEQIDKLKNV